jgi:Prophage tail length tape measure protein
MTQLTLSMLLRAEGAPAAKAAIQEVTTATDRLGTSTTRGATADRAAASAKQAHAQANRVLASTSNAAAQASGNLVAQFNDIFMMIGAGQNPLQTAIQQGTQITQVIGPLGAAGAAKSLGAAFVAMVSPINLVTLGAIAAGSAFIQWLTSADDDAAAVTAELDRQKEAIKGIIDETERLRLARGMMLSGAETENEQVLLNRNNDLLREREAIDARLAQMGTVIGNARQVAVLAEIEARRAAINVEIGSNNEKLVGLQRQRELNASTDAGRAIAERLRSATLGVTSALQSADGSRLVAAFGAAFPTASALLSLAQNIVATIGGAAQLQAEASGARYDKFVGVVGQSSGPDAVRTRQFGGGAFRAPVIGAGLAAPRIPAGAGAGAGGGGAGAAREEANALEELIRSLEGEIDALRVQDPIQKEMLRHREALAGATEAERQKVEALIATREREQILMEGAKARADFFEDLGNSALEALIVKGESFNDVLKNIAKSLIQAGLQAALFGSGPFGSLFGGKSILGQLFPALGRKAAGGMVFGPGTGTSDSIPTMLSNGEYVVNAKATARNRQLLEAINSGGLPGYAAGGMVGRASEGRRDGRDRGGPVTIMVDVRGAQGNTEVREMVRQGVQTGLQLYDREALPRSVQRVSNDQKRVN